MKTFALLFLAIICSGFALEVCPRNEYQSETTEFRGTDGAPSPWGPISNTFTNVLLPYSLIQIDKTAQYFGATGSGSQSVLVNTSVAVGSELYSSEQYWSSSTRFPTTTYYALACNNPFLQSVPVGNEGQTYNVTEQYEVAREFAFTQIQTTTFSVIPTQVFMGAPCTRSCIGQLCYLTFVNDILRPDGKISFQVVVGQSAAKLRSATMQVYGAWGSTYDGSRTLTNGQFCLANPAIGHVNSRIVPVAVIENGLTNTFVIVADASDLSIGAHQIMMIFDGASPDTYTVSTTYDGSTASPAPTGGGIPDDDGNTDGGNSQSDDDDDDNKGLLIGTLILVVVMFAIILLAGLYFLLKGRAEEAQTAGQPANNQAPQPINVVVNGTPTPAPATTPEQFDVEEPVKKKKSKKKL